LGYQQVGEVPDYPAVFLSDGSIMVTLWQASNPDRCVPFDHKNVIGLHHLALTVGSDSLDAPHERLKESTDVDIEFAPEPLGELPVRHLMCNIPGGIRVEFLASNA